MIRSIQKILVDSKKPSIFPKFSECLSTKSAPPDLEKRREELMKRGLPKQKPIEGVKNIVLVCSGKGGVGKSTVAVNIATAMKLITPNKQIGLLDTDVFGPSIPIMMNLRSKPYVTPEKQLSPLMNYGVKCMSAGFLVDKEVPIVWRGLKVMQGLETLIRQVTWGELEYLIVDTPPGTGDTLLSLVQNLPIAGVVLVTTPQSASLEITRRGSGLFKILKIPLIGIVENMSYVSCPTCSRRIHMFGTGTVKLAAELETDLLASFPLDPLISLSTDKGTPVAVDDISSDLSRVYQEMAAKIKDFVERSDEVDSRDTQASKVESRDHGRDIQRS